MLNTYFTENLLGLKDAIIKKIQISDGKLFIDLTMEHRLHSCPICGASTSKVHDYRTQIVKHTPAFGYPVNLRIRKRRHRCPSCGKRFFESISFLPKYQRTTNALWGYAFALLSDTISMRSVATALNVSASTVARMVDKLSYTKPVLPPIISIDEFRGNSGGEKFQCIITNPKDKSVLDILPTRKAEDLYRYFADCPERKNVRYVVMDLSPLFKSVAQTCFPHAKVVADKFHVLRLGNYALEAVRKDVQKSFHHYRRKYFKRSRTLLLKHKEKLSPAELEQVANMLCLSPRLAKAYYLKELIYDFFKSEDAVQAKKRLLAFKMAAQAADLPEFHKVAQTYTKWEKEILNAFTVPYTNGYTEGCNNRIKVMKRVSYGMPSFSRFRTRILHCMKK